MRVLIRSDRRVGSLFISFLLLTEAGSDCSVGDFIGSTGLRFAARISVSGMSVAGWTSPGEVVLWGGDFFGGLPRVGITPSSASALIFAGLQFCQWWT